MCGGGGCGIVLAIALGQVGREEERELELRKVVERGRAVQLRDDHRRE